MSSQEPAAGSVVGRGVARGVLSDNQPSVEFEVVRFQIERKDANDEDLPPVPAEMEALAFSGTLSDGDWVDVPDLWQRGQILNPDIVENLTTGVQFVGTPGAHIRWEAQARTLERLVVVLIGLVQVVIAVVAVIGGAAIEG